MGLAMEFIVEISLHIAILSSVCLSLECRVVIFPLSLTVVKQFELWRTKHVVDAIVFITDYIIYTYMDMIICIIIIYMI